MRPRSLQPIARAGAPMLKVGCCAYSYRDYLVGAPPRMTVEGFLDTCAEIGCDGVELTAYYFPAPLTPSYLLRVARRCFLLGLEITGTAVGNNFALPPGPERSAQLNLVRLWLDISAELGAPCLRVFAGPVPHGGAHRGRRWVIECLEECAPYAAERGVMLALENHGGVVATPSEILYILQRVPQEWVALKLDTGNFDSADPYADLEACAPYAVSTHVKTEIRREGMAEPADMARIAQLLANAGYRGYLNLEYEGDADAMTAVPPAIQAMRAAVQQPFNRHAT